MSNSLSEITKVRLWQGTGERFRFIIFIFVLFGMVNPAQGEKQRVLSGSTTFQPQAEQKLFRKYALNTGNNSSQYTNNTDLPELSEDSKTSQQEEIFTDNESPFPLDENNQSPDTCSQMLQFPFLENIIRMTGFSTDLPPDFDMLPRDQSFEIMREVLIRRGFSGFANWNNAQAIKRQWFLDFIYNVLEKEDLVKPEPSPEKRYDSLKLGGYISEIWDKENCACSEDINRSFSDLVITEILDRNRPEGPERPFPYYRGDVRELLGSDLINIITTTTGLSKRMYMSRQGISEENFCQVQQELLLRNGYKEFGTFDCAAYVSKDNYVNFLYNTLSKELGTNAHDEREKAEALVKHKYLPPFALYRQTIFEEDIYQAINDPLFIESLNRERGQEEVAVAETVPEFPDVYEEPVSRVR